MEEALLVEKVLKLQMPYTLNNNKSLNQEVMAPAGLKLNKKIVQVVSIT
jgi:hypothetical protein